MNDLIEQLKKYIIDALAVITGVATLLCYTITRQRGLIIMAILVTLIALYVIIKQRIRGGLSSMISEGRSQLGRRACKGFKVGPRDDEALALEANQLVLRRLGTGFTKSGISYATYRVWRQKNPSLFTPIVDTQGQLVGFFDILPLTPEAGNVLCAGQLSEKTLSLESFYAAGDAQSSNHIYIASLMVAPRFERDLWVKAQVVAMCTQFVCETYPPTKDRSIYAYGHTAEGMGVLRSEGFVQRFHAGETPQHDPLYCLTAERYKIALSPDNDDNERPKAVRRRRRRLAAN